MLQLKSLKILRLLVGQPYIATNEIKNRTGLSDRQVDYNLNIINLWLQERGFQKIGEGHNKSLYNNIDIDELYEELDNNSFNYILSDIERQIVIFLILYQNLDFVSSFHLGELLEVSRGTVQKDVNNLKRKVAKYNVDIVYSRKNGYEIYGEERNIDYFMMQCIMKLITYNQHDNILKIIISFSDYDKIKVFKEDLKSVIKENSSQISENNLNFISFTFYLYQIRSEFHMKNVNYDYGKIDLSSVANLELKIARSILNRSKEPATKDLHFLTTLLLSYVSGCPEYMSEDFKKVKKLINKTLDILSKSYAITLSNQNIVFNQLYSHIRPAVYRILFNYPIENPLKEQIIDKYGHIYIIVKEVFEDTLKPLINLKTNIDEISYLTIHFATFLSDEIMMEDYIYNAVIVCPGGVGVSVLLHQELSNLFPNINFLNSTSMENLDEHLDDIDVIFTTNVIKTEKPFLLVNPLMNSSEKNRLKENFYDIAKNINTRKTISVNGLLKIIEKHAKIFDHDGLSYELTRILSIKNKKNDWREMSLSDLIKSELIQINVEANDWKEAIVKSAEPLIREELISEDYVKAMIKNTEDNGPYIVISENVALPHARPEEGANKPAIGVTVLKKPVNFGNKKNDPVKYIFCLSAVDSTTHLKGLSELVDLLDDNEFYNVLDKAKNSNQIMEYIKERRSL